MVDGQKGCVQKRSLAATRIGRGLAVERPVVDTFAAQGRAALAEMDAHLVGPAGLEAAAHEREFTQLFDHFDMGDGFLSLVLVAGATAAISSITHQVSLDALG